jgi:hypothetical protein
MQNAKETTREYDSDLQMFCEAPREPAVASLRFLRWLAERGQLEHQVSGPPTGIYAAELRS